MFQVENIGFPLTFAREHIPHPFGATPGRLDPLAEPTPRKFTFFVILVGFSILGWAPARCATGSQMSIKNTIFPKSGHKKFSGPRDFTEYRFFARSFNPAWWQMPINFFKAIPYDISISVEKERKKNAPSNLTSQMGRFLRA